jgi:hypothetical protein
MLQEPDFIYYTSPWDWRSLVFPLFAAGVLVVVVWRRHAVILRKGKSQYYILVSACAVVCAAALGFAAWLFMRPERIRFAIHRDFVSCSSWSGADRIMRVPWHYITGIDREPSGRYMDVVLRFSFDRHYLGEVPWTDHVRTHGWVNCQVSWLTDDPRRPDFPTDTYLIHDQAVRAWRAVRNNPFDRRSYQELMQMKWENPERQRALEQRLTEDKWRQPQR